MRTHNLFLVGAALASAVAALGCGGSPNHQAADAGVGGNTNGGANSAGTGNNGGSPSSVPVSTVVGPPAVDVLFMVDNSSSMANKQQILAAAVPRLIARLAQPDCVDSSGNVMGQTQLDGTCAQGTPLYKPVDNLHVGVVTSSLGDHGQGSICTPGQPSGFVDANGNAILKPADVDDMAHLMGTLTRGASALAADGTIAQNASVSIDTQGFLAWGSNNQTPTSTDLTSAQHSFADMVTAAAEKGCGFEAQLESWFRFLVDPVPPTLPIQKDDTQMARRQGSDNALLAQRAAFLRPNSVLAIVMFTDENDCSLRDTDVGWVAADVSSSTDLTTGSTPCATNPNDPCCYSCTASVLPSGCSWSCPNPQGQTQPAAQDNSSYQVNIRCWHEKRRFGYEFLYPVSRYVVGLTKPVLCPDQSFGDMDCDCTYAKSIGVSCSPNRGTNDSRVFPNPLFSDVVGQDDSGNSVLAATQVAPRSDSSNIFLVGIVGVPWQDVGHTDSDGNLVYIPVTDQAWTAGTGLAGLGPDNPAQNGIWANIYGDDDANVTPEDPHMVESIEPRAGIAAGDAINGGDWNTAYEDLEYACTFPLPQSKPCACAVTDSTCRYQNPNDCCLLDYTTDGRGNTFTTAQTFDKPVCDGNTQVAARAYPGLREIAVLHDYAAQGQMNSVVGSICPKDLTSDPSSAGYGYNPVIDALILRMSERLPSN
jgi:hypothetical protein